jgi:hypothetical protein
MLPNRPCLRNPSAQTVRLHLRTSDRLCAASSNTGDLPSVPAGRRPGKGRPTGGSINTGSVAEVEVFDVVETSGAKPHADAEIKVSQRSGQASSGRSRRDASISLQSRGAAGLQRRNERSSANRMPSAQRHRVSAESPESRLSLEPVRIRSTGVCTQRAR